MALLSVNIDHIATVRQARYRGGPVYGEPDIVFAAHEAQLGGADGITVHLREDRRHVTDRDAEVLRSVVQVKFNLEMAATDEMVAIASRLRPHSAMLVPEGRTEVTTEGGIDVAGQRPRLTDVCRRLKDAGCLVSAFIDAEIRQIEAARACGFDVCEIHTGPYAHEHSLAGGDMAIPSLRESLAQVRSAGAAVARFGMKFNAGHALNFANVAPIASIPGIAELHIGHAIVSRAVFTGLRTAVSDMKRAMAGPGFASIPFASDSTSAQT